MSDNLPHKWRKQRRLADKHGRPIKSAKSRVTRREAVPPIPINQRLGFRPAEFAALVGVSYVTIWRAIKNGKIKVIDQNGIKVIPRAYAVKAGYLTD